MKFIIYIVVFCLLVYLLLLSFDDRNRNFTVSELDKMSETFVGAGVQTNIESDSQIQQITNIQDAQQEGDTVLDVAIESAKEELRQLDLSTQRLFKDIWSQTKSSAFKMAEDVAFLIYPPRTIKNPKRGFTAIHLQNEKLLLSKNNSIQNKSSVFSVQKNQINPVLHKTPFKADIK